MSKVDLQLMDDEGIILSYDGILYWNHKNACQVHLTNKNLIIVNTKGVFNVTYLLEKIPLSEVKVIRDEPQVTLKHDSNRDCYDLTILFKGRNEEISFRYEFLTKLKISVEAKKWYINLCNLVYEINNIDKSKSVLSDLKDAITFNKIKK